MNLLDFDPEIATRDQFSAQLGRLASNATAANRHGNPDSLSSAVREYKDFLDKHVVFVVKRDSVKINLQLQVLEEIQRRINNPITTTGELVQLAAYLRGDLGIK